MKVRQSPYHLSLMWTKVRWATRRLHLIELHDNLTLQQPPFFPRCLISRQTTDVLEVPLWTEQRWHGPHCASSSSSQALTPKFCLSIFRALENLQHSSASHLCARSTASASVHNWPATHRNIKQNSFSQPGSIWKSLTLQSRNSYISIHSKEQLTAGSVWHLVVSDRDLNSTNPSFIGNCFFLSNCDASLTIPDKNLVTRRKNKGIGETFKSLPDYFSNPNS